MAVALNEKSLELCPCKCSLRVLLTFPPIDAMAKLTCPFVPLVASYLVTALIPAAVAKPASELLDLAAVKLCLPSSPPL